MKHRQKNLFMRSGLLFFLQESNYISTAIFSELGYGLNFLMEFSVN